MSERPADPREPTGPIEPVDETRVERVEHVESSSVEPSGSTVEHVESTDVEPGRAAVEHRETTYAGQPPAAEVEHVEYADNLPATGVVAEEEGSRQGMLWAALAGVGALLLLGILWFAFLGPGRNAGQTNVNVAGGQSQQTPDVRINVNLTQQAQATATPTARPPTAAPTERPATSAPPPAAAPPAAGPQSSAPPTEAPAAPTAVPAQQAPAATSAPAGGQSVSAGAPPSGWRTAATPNGSCQYASPPDWQVSGTSARAPGDAATAALTSQPMSSWDAFKDAAKAGQAGATVREDTSTRLWLERQRDGGSVQHYIARPAGTVACAVQIDVTRDGVAQLQSVIGQIADTIGAAR